MDKTYDVIVAGAGIAGLALMRRLDGRDVRALAMEQRGEPGDSGLAINLPGNAIAAIGSLGLAEALGRFGRSIERREYRTDGGRLLFSIDEAAFWGATLVPRCIRRGDLATLLAKGMPAGSVRRNARIVSVNGMADEVEAVTADGLPLTGRLLVGADGVNSVVRRTCFGAEIPAAARLASTSWRFMAPNPGIECWTIWAGAKAMVLLIPVDDDEVYGWAATTKDGSGASDAGILDDLVRDFPAPVRDTVRAVLSGDGRMHYSPLDEVRLPRWSHERTVLIGDAAHATAPVWAEGAAMALEDAIVLADLLLAQDDWGDVPATYEKLRRPRVDHVQAATDRMSRAARLPVAIRNLVMPFVGPRSYRAAYEPLRKPVWTNPRRAAQLGASRDTKIASH